MTVYSHKDIEEKVKALWGREKTYEKAKAKRARGSPFYFADGPPYASGSIHIGTAWNKIIKDVYVRFFRMLGYNVRDQPGYDTHGTPIEYQVERELNFTNKKDIEKYGADRFIQKCRAFATKYIDVMSSQFADLGVWMDWKNPYLTLNNRYMEGAWFTFKKAYEKGFLYKGSYPVHVCTRCETVVAYNEIVYKNVADVAVYVKSRVKGTKNQYLIFWTTTPWTIPANTGTMVHPDFDYAYVKVHNEVWILAADLVEKLMERFEVGGFDVTSVVKGKELEGLEYEHPLADLVPALQNLKKAHRVVLSSRYVSLDVGTGIVHIAPGHGAEDFAVGKEAGLPILSPVNLDGTFTKEAGKWLEGKFTKQTDHMITQKLSERNMLVRSETYPHDYPFCWRCDTPLLFLNVPQWFFRVTSIRDKLLAENKKVNWVPEWAKDRFSDWLQNLGDWPVSRQRYWGIPLPIWECGCGEIEVIGSFEDLKKKSSRPLTKEPDFHRPEIDRIKLKCRCGKEMLRIPDVLDVWFDSGVVTWASLGYPRDKRLFDKLWPSDFQLEGPDQFRGWWNSQMITSMLTFGKAPFKNILLHGFIMDVKGLKLSKSRGNIVDPKDVIEKYGRDTMRFYMMSFSPWDNFYFNWDDVKETSRSFNILWNTHNFVRSYAPKPRQRPARLNVEDMWIISKVNSLSQEGMDAGRQFKLHIMVKKLENFVMNDLSRWYIKIIRDRVSPSYEGADKAAAQYALNYVLERALQMLAPVSPFISESLWRDLGNKESVHLSDWPKAEVRLIDKRLEGNMENVRDIIEALSSMRHEAGIRQRWPVKEVLIEPKGKEAEQTIKALEPVIKGMGNFEYVKVGKAAGGKDFPFGKVRLGEVLKDLAFVRELIRQTQVFRKDAKLRVEERIHAYFKSDKDSEAVLERLREELRLGVGASKVEIGRLEAKKGVLEFEGKKVEIGFKK